MEAFCSAAKGVCCVFDVFPAPLFSALPAPFSLRFVIAENTLILINVNNGG
jgi:hypothetical protein